jgi:hypothetical protein
MRSLLLLLTLIAACDAGARPSSPPQQAEPPPVRASEPTVPVALVIAFNGQEIFVGNDQYEPDENARYQGASKAMQYAFGQHSPARELPAGSQGAVVAYSTGTEVVVPMGDIARVDASVFSDQRPYRGKIGLDMVRGVRHGIDLLAKVDARRRILLVIGDGNDTNNEAARGELERMRREVDQLAIEATTIDYGGLPIAGPLDFDGTLGPVRLTNNYDRLAEIVGDALAPRSR